MSDSCDVGPYRGGTRLGGAGRRDAHGPHPPRHARTVLSAVGRAPRPRSPSPGRAARDRDADGPEGVRAGQNLLFQDDRTDTTHVVLRRPAAGSWTVTEQPGSPPSRASGSPTPCRHCACAPASPRPRSSRAAHAQLARRTAPVRPATHLRRARCPGSPRPADHRQAPRPPHLHTRPRARPRPPHRSHRHPRRDPPPHPQGRQLPRARPTSARGASRRCACADAHSPGSARPRPRATPWRSPPPTASAPATPPPAPACDSHSRRAASVHRRHRRAHRP